jgi:hypothetical protein
VRGERENKMTKEELLIKVCKQDIEVVQSTFLKACKRGDLKAVKEYIES